MSLLALCHTVDELSSHADDLPSLDALLTMLQQCFITVFKPAEPPAGTSGAPTDDRSVSLRVGGGDTPTSSPASFASQEEERLTTVHAVRVFHERGILTHRDFFCSADYHPHAALFIHGLLQPLGGHSRLWFRALQIACVETCSTILRSIGVANVRLCLPGVVSASARYLSRAHTRTDSASVKVAVLDLLRETLNSVFTMPIPKHSKWAEETIAHLGGVMHVVLSPEAILESTRDSRSAVGLKRLTMELLTTPCLAEYVTTPFVKELVVAYAIANNLVGVEFSTVSPLLRLPGNAPAVDSTGPLDEERPGLAWATLHLPDTIWGSSDLVDAVVAALHELRGVALLHVATTMFCTAALRERVVTKAADRLQLLASVVRKCVRLVGTEMPVESLFESRDANRPAVAQVVDRFLECCAHGCAILPHTGVQAVGMDSDDSDETPGEALTNLLLDEYERILQDWDLYMAHPPALYVITRVVLWQFKPLTGSLRAHFVPAIHGTANDDDLFPSPPQLVTARAFENLWSVVAPPHLWNITEDESLCSFQQIRHRQVVAATLLRFLGLAARDVLGPALAHYGDEGTYSWERFRALTLYLVLEKEAVSGPVHDAASACLREYAAASGAETALAFFLDSSHIILEEASRAVREAFLRPSVASVLRGIVDMIVASTSSADPAAVAPVTANEAASPSSVSAPSSPHNDKDHSAHRHSGTAQLALLVRQRLSVTEAAAAVRRHRELTPIEVHQISVCLTAAIRIATESCQLARRDGDSVGLKGALTLARDCLDVTVLVCRSVPLLPEDEDHERQTTSADPSVQQLQAGVMAMLHVVLTDCMSHSHGACVPFAVQVAIRAVTVFVDTEECNTWAERQRTHLVEAAAARRAEKAKNRTKPRLPAGLVAEDDGSDGDDDDDVNIDRVMQYLSLPPMPWPWTPVDAAQESTSAEAREPDPACLTQRNHLVLQRSHLKTVYRVYLSLLALLKEPVAAFHTAAAKPGRRSPAEKRALEAVRITPSVFTVLDALESLWDLSGDFMSARAVDEVLPLALVWYERATAPRIPTDTEARLERSVRWFAQRLANTVESQESKAAVANTCKPWFTLRPPATASATAQLPEENGHDAAAPSTPLPSPVSAGGSVQEASATGTDSDVYVSAPCHTTSSC